MHISLYPQLAPSKPKHALYRPVQASLPSPPRGQAAILIEHWTPEFLAATSQRNSTRRDYCDQAAAEVSTFASALYGAGDYVRLWRQRRQGGYVDRFLVRAHDLANQVDYKTIGHDPGRYEFTLQFVPRDKWNDRNAALGSRSVFVKVNQPSNRQAFERLTACGLPAPSLVVFYPDSIGVEAYWRTDRLLLPEEFLTVQGALSAVVNGFAWGGTADIECVLPGLFKGGPQNAKPVIEPSSSRTIYRAEELMDRLAGLLVKR